MYTIITTERSKVVFGQLALNYYLNECKERDVKVIKVIGGVV